jgi:hypothetical protein
MKKILLIICAISIVACSSSDDSDNNDSGNNDLSFYINAKVNGTNFNSGIPVDLSIPTDYGSSNSYQPIYNGAQCVNMNYEPSLYPFFDETKPGMSVGFIGFIGNANLTCAEELDNFDTLFQPDSYGYTDSAYSYGVKVSYATTGDANQVYYTSYGAQDNDASFIITDVEPVDCGFNECVIVSGTFSCRVYNEQDATDFLDITNGEFKLGITSWNP